MFTKSKIKKNHAECKKCHVIELIDSNHAKANSIRSFEFGSRKTNDFIEFYV